MNLETVGLVLIGAAFAVTPPTAAVVVKNNKTKAGLKKQGIPTPPTRELFVARLGQAIDQAKAKGAKLNKKAVIAQAALETGWGQHIPSGEGMTSNNLFGITRGSWVGPTVKANNRYWRVYESWTDCVMDYYKIIKSGYPQCLAHADSPKGDGNVQAWINGLVSNKRKWTPDAGYSDSLARVARGLYA